MGAGASHKFPGVGIGPNISGTTGPAWPTTNWQVKWAPSDDIKGSANFGQTIEAPREGGPWMRILRKAAWRRADKKLCFFVRPTCRGPALGHFSYDVVKKIFRARSSIRSIRGHFTAVTFNVAGGLHAVFFVPIGLRRTDRARPGGRTATRARARTDRGLVTATRRHAHGPTRKTASRRLGRQQPSNTLARIHSAPPTPKAKWWPLKRRGRLDETVRLVLLCCT